MTTWWRAFAREAALLAQAFANLVWPVTCAGCGAEDAGLCARCACAFAGPPFMTGSAAVVAPVAVPPPVWGLAPYGGTAARLIVAWKDRGRTDLSGPFGRALAGGVEACLRDWSQTQAVPGQVPGEVWLVPMPARRAALRARGTDLGLALAQAAARSIHSARDERRGRVRAVRVLRHVRRVHDQVGLDATERARNLAGSFGIRRSAQAALRGRKCIVVDDIVTTGASVAEAVRVLTAGGAQVVGVCCLSVTFHRQGVLTAA